MHRRRVTAGRKDLRNTFFAGLDHKINLVIGVSSLYVLFFRGEHTVPIPIKEELMERKWQIGERQSKACLFHNSKPFIWGQKRVRSHPGHPLHIRLTLSCWRSICKLNQWKNLRVYLYSEMGDIINEYREEWMHSAWSSWCSVADIEWVNRESFSMWTRDSILPTVDPWECVWRVGPGIL